MLMFYVCAVVRFSKPGSVDFCLGVLMNLQNLGYVFMTIVIVMTFEVPEIFICQLLL